MFNFFKKKKKNDLIETFEKELNLDDLNLDDLNSITKLKEFIYSQNGQNTCKSYVFLGKIGERYNINELTNFLIDQYMTEQSRFVKDSIHTAIFWQKKDETINLKPLCEIIKNYKKGSIVDPIIMLLEKSTNPEAENTLIHIIENDYNDFTKIQANAALHFSGTRKCIPYLMKNLNHNDNDLADSSFLALIRHSDIRETELFINELKVGKCKNSAMEGIALHSSIEAVDSVIERLKNKTSRQRKTDCNTFFFADNENEVTIGLKFLNRHKNSRNDIVDFFNYLEAKRKDKLFEYEFETLKILQQTPYDVETLKLRVNR